MANDLSALFPTETDGSEYDWVRKLPVMPQAAPNALSAGWSAGMREMGGLGGAAVQAVGTALGMPGVAKWGEETAASQFQKARELGRPDLEVMPWAEGGGGWGAALPFVGYQVAKMAPQVAAGIGLGAVLPEAAVPAIAGRIGAAMPEILGGAVSGRALMGGALSQLPMGAGSLAEAAKEGDGTLTRGEAIASLAGAVPYAAAGALEPAALTAKGTAGSLAARALTGAGKMGVLGGGQEAVQTAIEQMMGPPKSMEQKAQEIVDSAIVGAIGGGVFGGVHNVLTGTRKISGQTPDQTTTGDLQGAVDEALGLAPPTAPRDASRMGTGRVVSPEPGPATPVDMFDITMRKQAQDRAYIESLIRATPPSAVSPEVQLSPFGEPGGTMTPASTRLQLPAPEAQLALPSPEKAGFPALPAPPAAVRPEDVATGIFAQPEGAISGVLASQTLQGLEAQKRADYIKSLGEPGAPQPAPAPAAPQWPETGGPAPLARQLTARVIDENGQINLPGIRQAPVVDRAALEEEVNALQERWKKGTLTEEDKVDGPALIRELAQRQREEPSLFPDYEKQQVEQVAFAKTRADLGSEIGLSKLKTKEAQAINKTLEKLDATDRVDAINRVQDMLNDPKVANNAGVEALARHLGIYDAEGKSRNFAADYARLEAEQAAALKANDREKLAKIKGEMAQTRATQDLMMQAQERRIGAEKAQETEAARQERMTELGLSANRLETHDTVKPEWQPAWRAMEAVANSKDPGVTQQMREQAARWQRDLQAGKNVTLSAHKLRNTVAKAVEAQRVQAVREAKRATVKSDAGKKVWDDIAQMIEASPLDEETMGLATQHMSDLEAGVPRATQTARAFVNRVKKGRENAVRERRAAPVDVREGAGNGQTVGEGNAQGQEAPRASGQVQEARVQAGNGEGAVQEEVTPEPPKTAAPAVQPETYAEKFARETAAALKREQDRQARVRSANRAGTAADFAATTAVVKGQATQRQKVMATPAEHLAARAAKERETGLRQLVADAGAPRPLKEAAAAAFKSGDEKEQRRILKEYAKHVAARAGEGRTHALKGNAVDRLEAMNSDINAIARTGGATTKDMLGFIGETHSDPTMRELAQRLNKKTPETNLLVDAEIPVENLNTPLREGEQMLAGFDERSNTIYVQSGREDLATDMLHESVHAASWAAINSGGPLAQKLERLFLYAREKLGYSAARYYGLREDTHEFLAEGMTNRPFRQLLKNLPSPDQPSKSLWQSIKDAITTWIGGSKAVRSLLDDVMETGYSLMDEQAAMTPERIHELMRGQGGDPQSIEATTETAAMYARRADEPKAWALNALQDRGLGWRNIKAVIRGAILGWNTTLNLAHEFDKVTGSNFARAFAKARELRDTLNAKVNQMHKSALDAAQLWIAQDEKTNKPMLMKLMAYTLNKIDPRKDWAAHTWLHADPRANELRDMVQNANSEWDAFRQKGGVPIYEKLLAATMSDRYTQLAQVLHRLGTQEFSEYNLPQFTENPGDIYRNRSDLHDNPELSRDFWQVQMASRRDALKMIMGDVRQKYVDARTNMLAKLTPEQREAYRKAKKQPPPTKEMQAHADRWRELRSAIRSVEQAETILKQSPNFHSGRFGDYYVSAHMAVDANGNVDQATLHAIADALAKAGHENVGFTEMATNDRLFMRVENADQAADLRKVIEQLKDDGHIVVDPNAKFPKVIRSGPVSDPNVLRGMAPRWMERLIEMSRGPNPLEDMAGATDPEKEAAWKAQSQMMANLRRAWLEMLPDHSIKAILQSRKNVQGFNADMLRNHAHRGQVIAGAMASAAYADDVNKALTGIRQATRDMAVAGDVDKATKAHQIAVELATREGQRPFSAGNSWLDMARTTNHAYFLAASPAYVLEQLSQTMLLVWPQLAKEHGFLKSAQIMAKVTPMAFKVMKAIAKGEHALDAVVTQKALRDAGLPADVVKFLTQLSNRGGLDLGGFTREMGSTARGEVDTPYNRALRLANATAIYAETFSRVHAALAGRELWGHQNADLSAKVDNLIEEAMFNWGTWNNARQVGKMGMFGQWSPIMFSFMGYQIRMLEKLYREMGSALGGDKEARKFLAAHLGMSTLIAGTMGMPFATALAAVASKVGRELSDDENYDLNQQYREWLSQTFGKEAGEVIAHGLPRSFGQDWSKLGDQDLLPFTRLLTSQRKIEDASADWAKSMFGSPFSMGINMVKGLRQFADGDVLGALQSALPLAGLRNAAGAAQLWQDDYQYKNKQGVRLPIDASGWDLFNQALGIKQAKKQEYGEAQRYIADAKLRRQVESRNILDHIVKAQEAGDAATANEWMDKAAAFDTTHPANAVLPRLGAELARRAQEAATARTMGMPLGTNPRNPAERGLVGYANY